jgi:hypothetical protein
MWLKNGRFVWDSWWMAGGLFGTTIRFVASPVTVPFRRLFSKDLPADGGDVCGMAIGPENRSAKAPAGCR